MGGGLTGPIPDLALPKLKYLKLAYNKLTGTLPTFAKFKWLRSLRVNNNQLTGVIPTLPPSLIVLALNDNKFIGFNQTQISPKLSNLYLGNNNLKVPLTLPATNTIYECDALFKNSLCVPKGSSIPQACNYEGSFSTC
ncbi:hypothetical protein HDV06_001055 [Boothiomyces sp. JEL0866]|nr:hypothetical protein HDV06_001055 [Boothiomyces sp. JEL0866]